MLHIIYIVLCVRTVVYVFVRLGIKSAVTTQLIAFETNINIFINSEF